MRYRFGAFPESLFERLDPLVVCHGSPPHLARNVAPKLGALHPSRCDRLSLPACDLFENRCGGISAPHHLVRW
jgi:hypothetical protein